MRESLIDGTEVTPLTFVCLTVPESLRVIPAASIYRARFCTDNALRLSEIHTNTHMKSATEFALKTSRDVQHDGRDFKIVRRSRVAVAPCRPHDLGRGKSSPPVATSSFDGSDNTL